MFALLEYFAPARCAVCQALLADQPREAPSSAPYMYSYFCADCLPRSSSLDDDPTILQASVGITPCLRCGELTSARGEPCPFCAAFPLGVDTLRSATHYSDGFHNALRMMKYGGSLRLVRFFSHFIVAWLAREMANPHSPLYALQVRRPVIVPIPSHPRRIAERGYFHTGLIAHAIGRRFGLPVSARALALCGETPAQASLPIEARLANLRHSIRVRNRLPAGRPVLLFDDIVTTGASIEAAASALRSHGSCEILAVTIARSHRFQANRVKAQLQRAPS